MKTCGEYEDMISAFIDGALAEEDRAELMKHMAACPVCQKYFDQQIALHDALLADAEEIQPPEDFASNVMARVRFTPQEKKTKPPVRWQRWAALAACCTIVAAAALWHGAAGTGQVNRSKKAADRPTVPAGSVESRAAEDDASDAAAVPEPAAGGTGGSAPEASVSPAVTGSALPDEAASPEEPEASPDSNQQIAPQADLEPQLAAELPDEEKNVMDQRSGDGAALHQAAPVPAADVPPDPQDGPAALSSTPEAEKAPSTIVTASPAAAAWVEEALGLPWAAGEHYELTEEEYVRLRETLEAAGEDFTEQPGDADEFLLIAENNPETD